jgi:MFS family permease
VSRSAGSRTLAVLFGGVLLAALDIAIVGPALPSIQRSFGVDARGLSWVFNIYVLFSLIGAPLLAKLSDRYGRRVVYAACLGTFAAGSALVAASPTFAWLLVGRATQAIGAGGLLPVASAVVGDTFPADKRGRALGLIGAVFGLAFVLGPIIGGILLRYGWQWLFLVNLPFAAVLIVVGLRLLPGRRDAAGGPLDWRGAAWLSILMAAFVTGLSRIDSAGLGDRVLPGPAWMFLAIALAAAWVFWQLEKRAADPVIPPSLLRSAQLRLVGGIAAATGIVEAGMVFLPSLSVQAFDVSSSTASFMLLPLVAALIVGSLAAGRLLDRVGPKPVIQTGLVLTSLGLFLFAELPVARWSFYTAGICVGLGLSGLLGAPLRFIAMEEAGESRRGASQGLLTVFLSGGRMAGAAVIGGVVAAAVNELDGYRRALLYLGVVAALAALASTALFGGRRRTTSVSGGSV